MHRWLTVPRTGFGTSADPYRPDLSGVAGLTGWVQAATDGQSCLVLVVGGRAAVDAARAGTVWHGDETAAVTKGGTVYTVGKTLQTALAAEAERLKVAGLRPEGYDVGVSR